MSLASLVESKENQLGCIVDEIAVIEEALQGRRTYGGIRKGPASLDELEQIRKDRYALLKVKAKVEGDIRQLLHEQQRASGGGAAGSARGAGSDIEIGTKANPVALDDTAITPGERKQEEEATPKRKNSRKAIKRRDAPAGGKGRGCRKRPSSSEGSGRSTSPAPTEKVVAVPINMCSGDRMKRIMARGFLAAQFGFSEDDAIKLANKFQTTGEQIDGDVWVNMEKLTEVCLEENVAVYLLKGDRDRERNSLKDRIAGCFATYGKVCEQTNQTQFWRWEKPAREGVPVKVFFTLKGVKEPNPPVDV
eukprot:g4420.t1